jgi:nitronate monooxygenase
MAFPHGFRERVVLPAMVAPMFMVSGVDLVVASCTAGLIGTLTRNHCRTNDEFEAQLATVNEALNRARDAQPGPIGPLAANVSIGMPVDARAQAIDACRRHGVDIVVTAGGDPRPVADAVHEWGGRIFHDVTSVRFAEKAIEAGVDGVVAIGAGGGGHSGTISHLALVPQIRAMFDGVIVMAGAVATGGAIRAAEVLGADLAYLGTRFIATRESTAPEPYKQMLVSQMPADLLYSPFANGVPAMWMKESMRQLGLDPEALPMPARPRDTSHLPEGVKPWVNLWSAGQGVGLIADVPPVAELVMRLRAEYVAACRRPSMEDAASGEPA